MRRDDEVYRVGETIYISLSDVFKGDVIIKEISPSMVNLFIVPTKEHPKSKLLLKGMKDIKVQHSRTINKSTLHRHIEEGWKGKMAFFDWICIWKARTQYKPQ